jgi:hypothetical protein
MNLILLILVKLWVVCLDRNREYSLFFVWLWRDCATFDASLSPKGGEDEYQDT